jgi:hypothetical protein
VFHLTKNNMVSVCHATKNNCRYSSSDHFPTCNEGKSVLTLRKALGYSRLTTTRQDCLITPSLKRELLLKVRYATTDEDFVRVGALFYKIIQQVSPVSPDKKLNNLMELEEMEKWIHFLYRTLFPTTAISNKVKGANARDFKNGEIPLPSRLVKKLAKQIINLQWETRGGDCFTHNLPPVFTVPQDLVIVSSRGIMESESADFTGLVFSKKLGKSFWVGEMPNGFPSIKVSRRSTINFAEGMLILEKPLYLLEVPSQKKLKYGNLFSIPNTPILPAKYSAFLHGYSHLVQERFEFTCGDKYCSTVMGEKKFSKCLNKVVGSQLPADRMGLKDEFFPVSSELFFYPTLHGNDGLYRGENEQVNTQIRCWIAGVWCVLGVISLRKTC